MPMKQLKNSGMKIIYIVESLSNRLLIESILKDSLPDVEIKSVAKEKEFQKLPCSRSNSLQKMLSPF